MKSLLRGQKSTLAGLGADGLSPSISLSIFLQLSGSSETDFSFFVLDADGKLLDEKYFVFYNQPQSPCGAIMALEASAEARQIFQIELSRLPSAVKRIVSSAIVDGASSMRQITYGVVRFSAAGTDLAEFHLQGSEYADEKALMLAEIYWNNGWRFAATGQGFASGLAGLLRHFGGEVAQGFVSPPKFACPTPSGLHPPQRTVSLLKITLDKPGERKSINLEKCSSDNLINIHLNWDRVAKKRIFGGGRDADLDLGCMYPSKDGKKGVVQALGKNFRSRDREPYIFLDKDDRIGDSTDGENVYVCRPDLIDKVMVFAFIYEGAANFSTENACLVLHEKSGSETLIKLDAPSTGATFCAICLISRTASGLIKETRYFRGHPDANRYYGFGFN
jgi:tellurite resistance protein TerA